MAAEEKMARIMNLKQQLERVCEQESVSQARNEQLLKHVQEVDAMAAEFAAQSLQLRALKEQYKAYVQRMYPSWFQPERNQSFHASLGPRTSTPDPQFEPLTRTRRNLETEMASTEKTGEVTFTRNPQILIGRNSSPDLQQLPPNGWFNYQLDYRHIPAALRMQSTGNPQVDRNNSLIDRLQAGGRLLEGELEAFHTGSLNSVSYQDAANPRRTFSATPGAIGHVVNDQNLLKNDTRNYCSSYSQDGDFLANGRFNVGVISPPVFQPRTGSSYERLPNYYTVGTRMDVPGFETNVVSESNEVLAVNAPSLQIKNWPNETCVFGSELQRTTEGPKRQQEDSNATCQHHSGKCTSNHLFKTPDAAAVDSSSLVTLDNGDPVVQQRDESPPGRELVVDRANLPYISKPLTLEPVPSKPSETRKVVAPVTNDNSEPAFMFSQDVDGTIKNTIRSLGGDLNKRGNPELEENLPTNSATSVALHTKDVNFNEITTSIQSNVAGCDAKGLILQNQSSDNTLSSAALLARTQSLQLSKKNKNAFRARRSVQLESDSHLDFSKFKSAMGSLQGDAATTESDNLASLPDNEPKSGSTDKLSRERRQSEAADESDDEDSFFNTKPKLIAFGGTNAYQALLQQSALSATVDSDDTSGDDIENEMAGMVTQEAQVTLKHLATSPTKTIQVELQSSLGPRPTLQDDESASEALPQTSPANSNKHKAILHRSEESSNAMFSATGNTRKGKMKALNFGLDSDTDISIPEVEGPKSDSDKDDFYD